MISQQIDLVEGDFNGTAWRCSNRDNISTIDEAFADCSLPTLPGPAALRGPGSIPNNWADVSGFLTPPNSDRHWKVRMHGAFYIPRKTLGLRPIDQSCHHETWLHLDFVDWRNSQSHHEEPDRRILLKERPTPYQYGHQKRPISDIMIDHSLSSWPCDHSHAFVIPLRNVYIPTKLRDDISHSVAGMPQERDHSYFGLSEKTFHLGTSVFVLHVHRFCRDIAVVLIVSVAIWILDILLYFTVRLETGDSQDLKYGVWWWSRLLFLYSTME